MGGTWQAADGPCVRVFVVVDWRRQRVHDVTRDQAESQQWVRDIVARNDGDRLAATQTVALVPVTPDDLRKVT